MFRGTCCQFVLLQLAIDTYVFNGAFSGVKQSLRSLWLESWVEVEDSLHDVFDHVTSFLWQLRPCLCECSSPSHVGSQPVSIPLKCTDILLFQTLNASSLSRGRGLAWCDYNDPYSDPHHIFIDLHSYLMTTPHPVPNPYLHPSSPTPCPFKHSSTLALTTHGDTVSKLVPIPLNP